MAAIDVSQGGFGEPAVHAAAITPNDGAELTYVTRAVYVGGAGNLAVVMYAGETVTFTGVPAGSLLPIRVKQVLSSSTTATTILALW
jgi:hypothetical protein